MRFSLSRTDVFNRIRGEDRPISDDDPNPTLIQRILRPIKAVLFDLGNTLLYFDSPWTDTAAQADRELTRALREAGFDVDPAAFPAEVRSRLEVYYSERDAEFIEYSTLYVLRSLLEDKGYRDIPDRRLKPALQAMYRVTQAYWLLEPDAIPMLERLRELGYRLGAISNASDDDDVQALIDKAGIRPYFEVILTSAAAGLRKPHPRIFKMVLQRMGVAPAEAVMVGDTLGADILGAHNLGMRGIWITRRADRAANQAHADTIRPDAVIATLAELPGLLEEWNQA